MPLTHHQAKYFAHELTRRWSSDSVGKLAAAVAGAQVDLNPHQVDAALFAFKSPFSDGALLADEVGLGKTIEAGILVSQRWAERKRRILIITPSNLRKQWHQELAEKFFLPATILEASSYKQAVKAGSTNPFRPDEPSLVICSYHFARNKAEDVVATPWDLVVIDEAHRLRNVYKPSNVIANARILIEQSIGRGLRLSYGKRVGVTAVDRLNIVAHDKFQEIVDEANRPDSQIRMQTVVLDPDEIEKKTKTVISQSKLANQLGTVPAQTTTSTTVAPSREKTVFTTAAEQKVAQAAYSVIKKFESQPKRVPTSHNLANAEVQADMVREVAAAFTPTQLELDLSGLNFQPISDELWVQLLRTGTHEVIGLGKGGLREKRLENYVVSGLVDFDDIDYEKHADLLYDLASQTVTHLKGYLSEEQAGKVLWRHQKEIAGFIHAQMQAHYWEDEAVEYEVVISKGFTELKSSAYTAAANEDPLDFKVSPKDKSNMSKYLFGGFKRCLYPVQKFDSEAERILAVILDRETEKWFKPAKGLFQIFYRLGADHPEYQPDFVAETADAIYMLEPKKRTALNDADVVAKKDAAKNWCENATSYSLKHGGKPWIYRLIPHDTISENMSIDHIGKG